jgi:hypothetical protein
MGNIFCSGNLHGKEVVVMVTSEGMLDACERLGLVPIDVVSLTGFVKRQGQLAPGISEWLERQEDKPSTDQEDIEHETYEHAETASDSLPTPPTPPPSPTLSSQPLPPIFDGIFNKVKYHIQELHHINSNFSASPTSSAQQELCSLRLTLDELYIAVLSEWFENGCETMPCFAPATVYEEGPLQHKQEMDTDEWEVV